MSSPDKKSFNLKKWIKKTSSRVFIVYPLAIIILELLIDLGKPGIVLWGLPLIPWGYLQFRLSGKYRNRIGGGGPGFDVPPERLVTTGIFGWTRNPMYLGQMIYMTGFVICFSSLPGVALLIYHCFWYTARVKEDEVRLEQMFGQPYLDYKRMVKRWIPGIL